MSGDSEQALKVGLAKARTASSDKPVFFAMVLKGGSDGVLLVDKTKIAPANVQEAKKQCGGSAVVNGLCYGEDGALIFETPKVPGGTWAAAAKKMAQAAGVSIKAVFRLGRDPDSLDAIPSPPVDGEGETQAAAARWQAQIAVLEPKIKAHLAAGGAGAKDIALDFSKAKLHGRKGEFVQGETLLKDVAKRLATPTATKASAPTGEAAQWAERSKALQPKILAALKSNQGDVGKIRAVFAFAQEKATTGQFAAGLKSLDMLEKLLGGTSQAAPSANGGAAKTAPASPKPKGVSLVALQQCRLAWDTARKKAQTEIDALQKTIRAKASAEPDFAEIEALVKQFDKVKTRLDVGLADKLDEALNAADPQRRAELNAEASQMITQFQTYIASHPFLSHLDENPFVPVTVHKSLTSTLSVLASKLKG